MGNTISQHVRNAKAADNVPLVWRELFWNKSTITARNNVNLSFYLKENATIFFSHTVGAVTKKDSYLDQQRDTE